MIAVRKKHRGRMRHESHVMRDVGWDRSAKAWIAGMGQKGDPTRVDVMDAPMLAALPASGEVLDIGCGEGRFCRMMQARGLSTVGLDPTGDLLAQAQTLDPEGTYVAASGEALPFEAGRFDGVVSYLSLIDIKDFRAAIAEAARVLKTGGRMIIANLHAHATARPSDFSPQDSSWVSRDGKPAIYGMDEMMQERAHEVAWSGVRIVNYHRPLSAYLQAFLSAGLELISFNDPPYTGSDKGLATRWRRMPWAYQMVWTKKEMVQ